MKRLILLRHAKSSWDDDELDDHERPLSKRGERDAPRIAERLRDRSTPPALIVTSDARRARETAAIMAEHFHYPLRALRIEPALYLASPATMLAVIAAQDDRCPSLMIVGHNPGLTELAKQLLPNLDHDDLPTSGVVAIDFAAQRWAAISAADAALAFYDYPKNR